MTEEDSSPKIPFSSPPRDAMSGAMQNMTDTSNDIRNFELYLRGMKEDMEGNVIKVTEPLMNVEYIPMLVGLMSPANRNLIFGKHEKQEIRQIMTFANSTITRNLTFNRRKYGIKNLSICDAIHWEFLLTVYAIMNRGLDEGDKRFWGKTRMEIEQILGGQGKENKGLLNRFFNR